ncbi:MAG: HNH endonuclease [Chromatiales bacterium]|nr:HNH endonuclease [Chromatiales bacterium]
MPELSQQILRTDAAGMPVEWIGFQEAARLFHLEQVAYTCGRELFTIRGGHNAISGLRSRLTLSTIIATYGHNHHLGRQREDYTPPLNNPALFRRDAHLCLYCGTEHPRAQLSRDHVEPLSHGGQDQWTNVVTACKRCNNHKAGRTPEQADMELLAIPFTPTHAEYVYLQGRRVLADQMEFLRAHFPRSSPLRNRTGFDW